MQALSVSKCSGGIFSLKLLIMLKNILKLEGAQTLNKNEQKIINGGDGPIGLGEAKCPGNPKLCLYPGGLCGPCHL